jgi:hypothetical protein
MTTKPSVAPVVATRFVPLAVSGLVATILLLVTSTQQGGSYAGVFWDDGVYLITARALADGEGYRFVHLPGSPPAVHFPPAWPAVLALVWKLAPDFPANLAVFRLLNPVIAAVAAGLSCAYAIRRLGLEPGIAALATIVFAAALPLLVLDSVLFSEPAFLALLIGTFLLADRAVETGAPRAALLAGLLAAATTLTRSAGLLVVPALVGALLLTNRRRSAGIALATALALILPWQAWSSTAAASLAEPLRGNYGPYLPWLGAAIRDGGPGFVASVAWTNMVSMQQSLAAVFFPVGLRAVRPVLVAMVVIVGCVGVQRAWKRARPLCLFLAFYTVTVVLWPYAPDRFAWAVWPLIGALLAVGATASWQVARAPERPLVTRMAGGVFLGVTLLAAAGAAFYSARGVSRGWADLAQRRNAARLLPIVDWVNRHTPDSAVVATDGEPLVHLYTGRPVLPVHILSPGEHLAPITIERAAEDLWSLITAGRADFVVLSAGSSEIEAARLLAPEPASRVSRLKLASRLSRQKPASRVPRLAVLDSLPGGGIAYRVHWQD